LESWCPSYQTTQSSPTVSLAQAEELA
jgi:hypothetical protein